MVLLLALMIPVSLVCGVALLAPPAIDLVQQPERVPIWWGVPLLFVPFAVFCALAFPVFLMQPGGDRYYLAMGTLLTTHLAVSGVLLWMSVGLALVRGLRPCGETRRKRRTTVLALLLLVPVMLALVFLPVLVGETVLMFWAQLPAAVALLWVISLNREGAARLMNARRTSAGWLVASAVSAWAAVTHGFIALGELEFVALVWVVSSLAATLFFVGGLRVLTPIAPLPAVVAFMGWGSLLVPAYHWWSFSPLPAGVEVPEFVDLRGSWVPGQATVVGTMDCLLVPRQSLQEGPGCGSGTGVDYAHVAYGPDVPLTEVIYLDTQELLVDRGRQSLYSWYRWSDPVVIVEREGHAHLVQFDQTFDLGPELQRFLEGRSDQPLDVVRTPAWTYQDFVSICASTGPNPSCRLVDGVHAPSPSF